MEVLGTPKAKNLWFPYQQIRDAAKVWLITKLKK